LNDELSELIQNLGEQRVLHMLRKADVNAGRPDVLTIIANARVHHLPPEFERGVVHVASSGNLDFSSIDSVKAEYEKILRELARVLKSRSWRQIYLVPFGPTTLSLQIKILVFRITSIDTVDLFYDGKGSYHDIVIEQRAIIAEAD
jgi:hypothetical protein